MLCKLYLQQQLHNMDVVFHALILSKVRYAMCVYGGHLTVTQKNRLNAFLCLMQRHRFTSEIYDIEAILSDIDFKLFNKMCNDTHCISSLLPCNKTNAYGFRDRKHHFELHLWHFSFFWNSFVMRCVHNYNCLLLSLLSCLVFGIGFSMLSLVNFFFIFYIFLDFISMSLVLVLVE